MTVTEWVVSIMAVVFIVCAVSVAYFKEPADREAIEKRNLIKLEAHGYICLTKWSGHGLWCERKK